MLFRLTTVRSASPPTEKRPVVCLTPEHWDDYGYRTLFYATLLNDDDARLQLGHLKLLHTGTNRTAEVVPEAFQCLSVDFVSVWQEEEAYERIYRLDVEVRTAILQGLRDASVVDDAQIDFEQDNGWSRSLLRFSSANSALRRANDLRDSHPFHPEGPIHFAFRLLKESGESSHELEVEFDPSNRFGRIFVIAGPNSSGKTGLLAAMADHLSGYDQDRTQTEPPTAFRIHAISYSAFDRFRRPNRRTSAYRYSGLRPEHESSHNIDVDAKLRELARRLNSAESDQRRQIHSTLRQLGIVTDGEWSEETDFTAVSHELQRWSAGHQVVTLIVGHLVLWLKPGSLVLFDEPELHLHPALLSSLLRWLGTLLVQRKSYCLVATHSPIPLQEVPSQFVRVLDCTGDVIRGRSVPEQTFGAELNEIVRLTFGLGPEDRNFFTEFDALIREVGPERASEALRGNLSLATRVLVDIACHEDER